MSAKTSNQPDRRTPLSHSGGATQNDRGVNSSNSSIGQTNNTKLENKNKTEKQQTNAPKEQQAVGPKENSAKLQNKQTAVNADSKIPKQQEQPISGHTKSHKLTNQNDKTQQLSVKQQQLPQNGVSNNLKTAENQQEQITKDKQQNANAELKPTEMDSKEPESTQDKHEMKEKDKNKNDAKEKNKVQKKSDKDKQKQQNDKKKQEIKKDKEIILEVNFYNEVKQKEHSCIEKKAVKNAEAEHIAKDNCIDHKVSDETTTKDGNVVENTIATPHQQEQQHNNDESAPSASKLVKNSKQSTPNKPTPSKTTETPPKKTPTKQEVTTCIDDYEMESLKVECSPSKQEINKKNTSYSTFEDIPLQKSLEKTDIQLVMQPSVSAEKPITFSRISGRRAIHPITGYTPSKLQSNLQFREPYRTVGSEMSNKTSLERGRKRGCTQQQHSQSAMGEMQNNEIEISPYKRPRMAFFSVVSSPLSMLRNRFSKSTLQSSTPVKLQQKFEENEDDDDVQNVSSESVLEDIEKFDSEHVSVGDKHASLGTAATTSDKTQIEGELEIHDVQDKEFAIKTPCKEMPDVDDIKMIESKFEAASVNSSKNKRCIVM